MPKIYPFLPEAEGGRASKGAGGYVYKGGPGSWTEDPELLTHYPGDMSVGQDKVESYVLTSIPDAWARAHFFHHALLNLDHPAHESVLDEWRGLLGLICFAETYGIDLHTESIDLEAWKDAPFARILLTLVPEERFKKFNLIYAGDQMIGATSPFSFVFVPPSYKVPEGVPWHTDDGRLANPIKFLNEEKDEYSSVMLRYFKYWLGKLKEQTPGLALGKDDKESLNALIDAKLLDEIEPEEKSRPWGDKSIVVIPDAVELRCLSALEDEGPVQSDLQMSKEGLRADFVGVAPLIYWEEKWKENLKVFRSFKSANVKRPSSDYVEQFMPQVNLPCIDPIKHFFTETITRVDLAEGAVRGKNAHRYLLPLRNNVLKYFDADKLDRHFDLIVERNETVTVELRIPLTGKGKKVVIRHKYDHERINTIFDRNTVAIWPNVKLSGWNWYLLYAEYPGAKPGRWTCEPGGATIVDRSTRDYVNEEHFWRLAAPPDAVVFSREGEEMGMLLPLLPDPPAATGGTRCNISVDFGTSNTSVGFSADSGEQKPKPVNFGSRVQVLMSNPDSDARDWSLAVNLIPQNENTLKSPFPSIYSSYKGPGDSRPWLGGNIPFEPKEMIGFLAKGGNPDYKIDLKWSRDKSMVGYVEGFLSQVLIMSFLEARVSGKTSCTIHWTYPSAFDRGRRNRFQKAWSEISKQVSTAVGIESQVATPQAEDGDPTITESIAVCRFAQQYLGATAKSPNRAFVSLDIGGGTTDTAIWRGGDVLAQASVMLAGREIANFIRVCEPFAKQLLEWNNLGEEPWLSGWLGAFQDGPAAVNEFFRRHGDAVSQRVRVTADASAAGRRALSLVNLLLGGTTYYAGTMLRASGTNLDDLEGVDLVYAGNISRLLHWIGEKALYGPRMAGFLIRGGVLSLKPPSISVAQSTQPKLEVALGIISPQKIAAKIPEPTLIIAEEGLSIKGPGGSTDMVLLPPETDLTYLAETEPARFRSAVMTSDLPGLRAFVDYYNSIAKEEELDLIPASFDWSKVKSHINQMLRNYGDDPENRVLMSPFAEGVHYLCEYLATQPVREK